MRHRDSLQIKTTEIPWTTQASLLPLPCYSDNNINVYAIPVLPFEPSDPAPEPAVSGLEMATQRQDLPEKRKRDSSPDSPRKRLNQGGNTSDESSFSKEVLAEVTSTGFDPTNLTGSLADEYRQMVVKAMFPYTNPSPVVDAASKADQRQRSRQGMAAKKMRDEGKFSKIFIRC